MIRLGGCPLRVLCAPASARPTEASIHTFIVAPPMPQTSKTVLAPLPVGMAFDRRTLACEGREYRRWAPATMC